MTSSTSTWVNVKSPILQSSSIHGGVQRPFHQTSRVAKRESGVPTTEKPLSSTEINAIFGRGNVSATGGNRILAVLQGRRLSGTLDQDLPADITTSVRQATINRGLAWLRENVPVDEDAAILARVEREDREEEEKHIRRAEELGLYKPQSGTYWHERVDESDVYGKSSLKELQKRNQAKAKMDEEQRRREWLESEQKEREALERQIEKNRQLQVFDENAVVEGRCISFISSFPSTS